jgi:DNA-binding NtrC family response regulator
MTKTILLIDDEANVLSSLSRSLHKEDYRIFTARSADECVHILKAHPVDLVVSDEMMEGMRGTDFLHWVATFFGDIPRILLTGHLSAEVEDRAVNKCNVYRAFSKPCNIDELSQAIRGALEQKSREIKPDNEEPAPACLAIDWSSARGQAD